MDAPCGGARTLADLSGGHVNDAVRTSVRRTWDLESLVNASSLLWNRASARLARPSKAAASKLVPSSDAHAVHQKGADDGSLRRDGRACPILCLSTQSLGTRILQLQDVPRRVDVAARCWRIARLTAESVRKSDAAAARLFQRQAPRAPHRTFALALAVFADMSGVDRVIVCDGFTLPASGPAWHRGDTPVVGVDRAPRARVPTHPR